MPELTEVLTPLFSQFSNEQQFKINIILNNKVNEKQKEEQKKEKKR